MSRAAAAKKRARPADDEQEEDGKERRRPAAANPGAVSVSLGRLVPALVLRRPSASVKTPYVADVLALKEGATPAEAAAAAAGPFAPGAVLLAHSPAMDAAGLIVPGRRIRCAPLPPSSAARRCTHSVIFAEDTRTDTTGDALVCAQPAAAERLAAAALRAGAIRELVEAGGLRGVLAQQTVTAVVEEEEAAAGGKSGKAPASSSSPAPTSSTSSSSRVDFVLERADGSVCLVEIKIVVCADYPTATGRAPALVPALAAGGGGGTPKKKKQAPVVGVYTPQPSSAPYSSRTAIFPHGAVKKDIGVVSDRAIKHVHHLEEVLRAGRATVAGRERHVSGAAVLFVVARDDCAEFRPCHEACPVFARVLRRAQRRGVQVLAYDVEFSVPKSKGGKEEASMALRRSLPVRLGLGLGEDEDDPALDATIARILAFNATDPRTHYKKGKKKEGAAAAAPKKKKKAKKQKKKKGDGDDEDDETEDDDEEYRPASGR